MATKVLCLHHSGELYGSDRSFLDAVDGLIKRGCEVVVCLPESGPLEDRLREVGATLYSLPLTKLTRKSLRVSGVPSLVANVFRAYFSIRKLSKTFKPDIIYSNTIAVIDGGFYSRIHGIRHVWHVREIIEKPMVANVMFRFLVRNFARLVIVNSYETKKWLLNKGSWGGRVEVLWNGVETQSVEVISSGRKLAAKESLGIDRDSTVLLLAGRINEWKGHWVFLDALKKIQSRLPANLKVVFAGSVSAGKGYLEDNLRARVNELNLQEMVRFLGFVDDMSTVYQASDLSVVPSILPEPFGRTAVESMAYGIPVIASNHGGLKEIVEDGVSGMLVEPGDPDSLASAILTMLTTEGRIAEMGKQAHLRAESTFSLKEYQRKVCELVLG